VVVSVYVALSADASVSYRPPIDAPCDGRKSHFSDPSVRKMRKTPRQKAASPDAPRKSSKKMKVDVNRALDASAPRDGLLLTADFDKSEWEIMYPVFVVEDLIDPSTRVIRRNT
jgi:hypothetical protein